MATRKHWARKASSAPRYPASAAVGKDGFARRRPGSRVAEKTLAETRIYLPEVTPGPIARRLIKALEARQT